MFVTSAREVPAPRCRDFIGSPFEDFSNYGEFMLGKPVILLELQLRFQPELRLAFAGRSVDVHSWFFSREKEKAIRTLAKDRRTLGTAGRIYLQMRAWTGVGRTTSLQKVERGVGSLGILRAYASRAERGEPWC